MSRVRIPSPAPKHDHIEAGSSREMIAIFQKNYFDIEFFSFMFLNLFFCSDIYAESSISLSQSVVYEILGKH